MQDAIINLVATFLGVLGTFYLERLAERRRDDQQKSERKGHLISGLRRSLDRNFARMDDFRNEMAQQHVPTFTMDAAFLDFALPHAYELIADFDDLAAIERVRYEMHHFEDKLGILRRQTRVINEQVPAISLRPIQDHLDFLDRDIRVALEVLSKYAKQ